MIPIVLLGLSLTGLAVGLTRLRRARALSRLEGLDQGEGDVVTTEPIHRTLLKRRKWIPYVFGLVALVAIRATAIGWLSSCSIAALVFAISVQVQSLLHVRKQIQLEAQLAEALDLTIGALRAGVGLVEAMTASVARVGQPTRGLIQLVVDRLRVGDSPPEVFNSLGRSVPLESFRLTGLTLAATWEGGGGFADSLSGVGRATRERLSLRRRMNSQSLESRVSVVVILLVTWVLFVLSIVREPEVMRAFALSDVGDVLIAILFGLEAVGLVWIDALASGEV